MDRLFHTVGRGRWKAKLRWSTDVCTLGRSTHPVDAYRRRKVRGRLPARRILVDMEVRRRVDAFPYEDASLEDDPFPHRKSVEAA